VIRYHEDFAPGQKFMRAQSAEAAMLNYPSDGERSTQFPDAVGIWKAKHDTSVIVRPIEPGDFERERRFVDGLSPRAGYQRLMSPRKPSDAELRRWTDIDPTREGALVAIASSDGEARQIGVARYAMESQAAEAEFAIVLSDDWQGRGLGAYLLSCLIELARRSGVRRLFGTTLSENQGMLALARRLGFKMSRERGSAFVTMMSLTLGAEA
jgi:RimJ/RimL family protein N-acetyltransferase